MRLAFWIISGLLILLLVAGIVLEIIIADKTAAKLYDDVQKIPYNRVGLVLGTAKNLTLNKLNPYFVNRIAAALLLYRNGKVDYLVVSGDNRHVYYNEPREMKKELVQGGVPAERIRFDFAGLNTYVSVLRMKKIFLQDRFTLFSQKFQNQRAIFIANHYGLRVVGFNAADVSTLAGVKVFVRERLARFKLVWDLLILREPRFLGSVEKIE